MTPPPWTIKEAEGKWFLWSKRNGTWARTQNRRHATLSHIVLVKAEDDKVRVRSAAWTTMAFLIQLYNAYQLQRLCLTIIILILVTFKIVYCSGCFMALSSVWQVITWLKKATFTKLLKTYNQSYNLETVQIWSLCIEYFTSKSRKHADHWFSVKRLLLSKNQT